MISKKSKLIMMKGRAYVDNVLVTEAEFTVAIVDKVKNEEE